MKIGFNFIGCGMGNNGGTRTIIKCSETIKELGHESILISHVDNFNWFPHDKAIKSIPKNIDALVATACSTVDSTLKSGVKTKAWYIRGHENWGMSEKKLGELYREEGIKKICNSKGLEERLKDMGAKDTCVVYQGVDINFWKYTGGRISKKTRIGCLYNTVHKTKRWDSFKKLASLLGKEEYEFVSFGDKPCGENFLSEHLTSPKQNDLRDFYSRCHIWFAPTENEGLHNPPMEAALCGCLIVCSNSPNNGMIKDYAFKDKTAMVYENIEESADIIRSPNYDLIPKMNEHIVKNIGTREINMIKFVDILNVDKK